MYKQIVDAVASVCVCVCVCILEHVVFIQSLKYVKFAHTVCC